MNNKDINCTFCNMTAVPYPLFYWRVCPCSWLMNRGFPNCNTCSIINDFISERSTKHRIINLSTIHDQKVHPYYRYYKILILFVKKKNNDTVNQLSFLTTMFHELPEIKWFTLANFCDQALSMSPGKVIFFYYNYMHWQIPVRRSKKYLQQ